MVASLLSDSFDRHALELLERMLTLDPECVSGCSSPSFMTHDIAISNCPLLCRITSEEWGLHEISGPPEVELRGRLFWEHCALRVLPYLKHQQEKGNLFYSCDTWQILE